MELIKLVSLVWNHADNAQLYFERNNYHFCFKELVDLLDLLKEQLKLVDKSSCESPEPSKQ